MKVLIVCSGNTCRSPMAEVLLRHAVERDGIQGVTVQSAGTGASEGEPASEGAYLVALEDGLDLSSHRSARLTAEMVRGADLILTMSRTHLARVETLGGVGRSHLLGEYGGGGERAVEIRDPFGGEVSDYRDTFRQLRRLVDGVAQRLQDRGSR